MVAIKSGSAASDKIQCSWLVMVYMATEISLSVDAHRNLRQMLKMPCGRETAALAWVDEKWWTSIYEFGIKKRKRIFPAKRFRPTNSGNPKTLQRFIDWAFSRFEPQHCALVLWGHGRGLDDALHPHFSVAVDDPRLTPQEKKETRRINDELAAEQRRYRKLGQELTPEHIADDRSGDYLTNLELKTVLEGVATAYKKKIDILALDSCLMAMVEFAFEIKSAVRYMVISQEREPTTSWPYDRILKLLCEDPSIPSRAFASEIVRQYLARYHSGSRFTDVTLSSVDNRHSDDFFDAIKDLASELIASLADRKSAEKIGEARGKVQAFYHREYVDIAHFCGLLSQNLRGSSTGLRLLNACKKVLKIQRRYVDFKGKAGRHLRTSSGISIYFPPWIVRLGPVDLSRKLVCDCEEPPELRDAQSLLREYSSLSFSRTTKWGAFLLKALDTFQPYSIRRSQRARPVALAAKETIPPSLHKVALSAWIPPAKPSSKRHRAHLDR
jgi:hypothetical protein